MNKNVNHAQCTQLIVDYIVGKDLTDIVLLGHSFGGIAIAIPPKLCPIAFDGSSSPIAVQEIKPFGNQFDVVFEDGTMKQSRKILLAFGVIDEFPDIENFGEFCANVLHYRYCSCFGVIHQCQ